MSRLVTTLSLDEEEEEEEELYRILIKTSDSALISLWRTWQFGLGSRTADRTYAAPMRPQIRMAIDGDGDDSGTNTCWQAFPCPSSACIAGAIIWLPSLRNWTRAVT